MKAILFDLDGTLTDSGEGIMNCAKLALEHYGIHVEDEASLRVFVGPPLQKTFVEFGVPKDEVDNAIRIYRERYIPIGKFENTPYPGICQLLQKLRDEGYKLYVATSKPEETSVEILDHFDMTKYFDIVCGASFDVSRHSKDKVIEYLLERIGEKVDAIMVGDTAFDVLGAKVHGIPTIGVSWGYGKVSDMIEAGAAGIANSMDELYQLLTK